MICRSCRIAICLIVATTLSILATLPIVYAQSNDPGNINKYYSDDVLADSVVFTCTIHLPEDGCPPKGISNYYMTVFSGKEKTHIHDLESLGRFSRRLREDLCMRYIPESYSCFMSHADFNNLKKGESHVMTIQMYPKLPLNDLSSPVVQDILSVCDRLSSKRWVHQWHLSSIPPKELSALRTFAFRRIPTDLFLENESVYVVELQPNPSSYFRSPLLFVSFPSSGKIFEFREYDQETRCSEIPAAPEQSVLELIERVHCGQPVPAPPDAKQVTGRRYYNVLVLKRMGEHFIPLAYEQSGVVFDPLSPDLRKQLEELVDRGE